MCLGHIGVAQWALSPRGIQMNASIRNFLIEEDGITALEYGILACIVAALLISVFQGNIKTIYTDIMNALSGAVATADGSST
jgi:pilus assembly protein Flp/PilA